MTKTFEELYRLDVSGHVEKKANLSYLSWAWAHAEMKKADPDAVVTVHEFEEYIEVAGTPQTIKKPFLRDAGGAWVKVSVTMNGRTETELLPVMDHRNKALADPDAMAVNKNIKRCFVKALALHGLGLFLYVGDDLPEAEPPKPATKVQKKMLGDLIEETAGHVGKAYEQMEKMVMAKQNVTGRFDNITNEDYGLIFNYVKELLDYYAKNPQESKAKKEEPASEEAEQADLKLEYPQAKK